MEVIWQANANAEMMMRGDRPIIVVFPTRSSIENLKIRGIRAMGPRLSPYVSHARMHNLRRNGELPK